MPTEVEIAENQHTDAAYPYQFGIDKTNPAVHNRQGDEHSQGISARDAVDAIHKIVGVDDARADNQGNKDNPPRLKGQEAKLIEHQKHGGEMHGDSESYGHRPEVVDKAHRGHQGQAQHKPRIFKARTDEKSQGPEIEHHPSASQRAAGMAGAMAGPRHDAIMCGELEIYQLAHNQDQSYDNEGNHLCNNVLIDSLIPSSALTGIWSRPRACLSLALETV